MDASGNGGGFAAFGYAGFGFADADESAAELARCLARDRSAALLEQAATRDAASRPRVEPRLAASPTFERPRTARGGRDSHSGERTRSAHVHDLGTAPGTRRTSSAGEMHGAMGSAVARAGSADSIGGSSAGTASPSPPGTPMAPPREAAMMPRPPSARAPRPPSAGGPTPRPPSSRGSRPGSARLRPRPGSATIATPSGAAVAAAPPPAPPGHSASKQPPPPTQHANVNVAPPDHGPEPPRLQAMPKPSPQHQLQSQAAGGVGASDEWCDAVRAAASAVQKHLQQPASSAESADAAGGVGAGEGDDSCGGGAQGVQVLSSVAAIGCLEDVRELCSTLERGRLQLRAPAPIEVERSAALSALFGAMDAGAAAVAAAAGAHSGTEDSVGRAGLATAAMLQARSARGALHILLPPLLGGGASPVDAANSEAPLLHVYRSLYRLSKDSANDSIFAAEGLLHPTPALLAEAASSALVATSAAAAAGARSAAATPAELLVYVAGAMKNASSNSANAAALADAGAVMTLCRLIAATAAAAGDRRGSEAAAQLLVQVTGTLRNLSVEPSHAELFADAGAAHALADCVASFAPYGELMRNVSRVASKLTSHPASRAHMEEEGRAASAMIACIAAHPGDDALVLRAAFALGNVTACSEECRLAAVSAKGAVEALARTMASYRAIAAPPPPLHLLRGDKASGEAAAPTAPAALDPRRRKALDVLVKLVRVIGNLAISAEAATHLVGSRLLAGTLLALLQEHAVDEADELVLNVVSTVSNLTFYEGARDNHILLGRRVLVACLAPLLLCGREDAISEAARCFGNLSRYGDVREEMAARKVDVALCILLDHSDSSVLYSSAGVLMNVAADEARRAQLSQPDNVDRLVDSLAHALYSGEAALAGILLKTLFNLCATVSSDSKVGECEGFGTCESRRAVLTRHQGEIVRHAVEDYLECGGAVEHDDGTMASDDEDALSEALGLASQMARLLEELPVLDDEGAGAYADSDESGSLEELEPPPEDA